MIKCMQNVIYVQYILTQNWMRELLNVNTQGFFICVHEFYAVHH